MKLMTHVVAGCPNMPFCEQIILQMAKSAVDFIEIQIPFSDPVADGPTMMKANEIALANGTKIKDAFALAERVNQQIDTPLFFMGYFNNAYKFGIEKFCAETKRVGVKGVILPDLPFDEALAEDFFQECQKNNLAFIQVVSENTTKERLEKIAQYSKGNPFTYCTARLGITGTHAEASAKLGEYLAQVQKIVQTPLAVGFGISDKRGVEQVAEHAEIAVIGSRVMNLSLDETKSEDQRLQEIRDFLKPLFIK